MIAVTDIFLLYFSSISLPRRLRIIIIGIFIFIALLVMIMRKWILLVLMAIIPAIITAGCLTTMGVESVAYEDSAFVFQIRESGIPDDLMALIIIQRIDGLFQEEEEIIYTPLKHIPGEDTVTIDTPLPDGFYKAHIILFQDGKRLHGYITNFQVDSTEQP
ncbi:hypothetical protein J2T58_000430 [Methanocalculus alkaliphilus]|uniref:hypothetical protein n=1 Tax=Methanocalculus alkaliphilus TaxID=768730 RepID=UPI00209D37B5|nr:hypothetical protein [Methanocalculus alkaliphilus]MCP1714590.1 hypothetical protein [Methanocalculus alkaliphilus]